MARPLKRTPQLEEAIIRALRAGTTRSAAAEYVGVDRTQLWRWMKSDSTFCNAIVRAEAEAEVACTGTLRKAAQDGDWHAALAWLERRRGKEWGRQDKVDVTIRRDAKELAAEFGLPLDEVEAEYKRILAERS